MSKHTRWFFNLRNWTPTKSQWLKLTSSIDCEELARINKFVFQDDAKASLIGQTLIRAFLGKSLKCETNKITLTRDDYGKPIITNDFIENYTKPFPNLEFNISHSGDYCVLVGYCSHSFPNLRLGVDVTQIVRKKTTADLNRFLELMSRREFSTSEWENVRRAIGDRDKSVQFTRLWCLKESYIKAIGLGLSFDLARIEFSIRPDSIRKDLLLATTTVKLNGKLEENWTFLETKIDDDHLVAIGYKNQASTTFDLKDLDPTSLFDEVSIDWLVDTVTAMNDPNCSDWVKFSNNLVKDRS